MCVVPAKRRGKTRGECGSGDNLRVVESEGEVRELGEPRGEAGKGEVGIVEEELPFSEWFQRLWIGDVFICWIDECKCRKTGYSQLRKRTNEIWSR